MYERAPLPAAIMNHRLIAVLRAASPDYLVQTALALYAHGVRCIEVALTTPGAFDLIRQLRDEFGADAAIGAGTVMSIDDVRESVAAGATFLLAPVFDPQVLDAAHVLGIAFVPGAATPTEIWAAWEAGASAVKVFPAASLGGANFIKSVLDPLPGIPLIPTGGVGADQARGYLNAGAIAVGVGTPLTGDALAGGSLDQLSDRVSQFLNATGKDEANR
jgi:2-dehydro-3-deoxyphosphogluconate aldolase/(4S)-4-hydroxy-2-oxoglutarate aldolase